MDLITFGEAMVSFTPLENVSIKYASAFGKKIAGAESNVAIGLSKLGKKVGWFGKLGNDEFGEYILRELKGEGVDTSSVVFSKEPTGIMFKQLSNGGETSVFYYRKASAASTMTSEELPLDYMKKAKILHVSGITPALSDSCKELVFSAINFAKANNILVSFDPNIRLKLWSKEEARQCLSYIIKQADIVLIGDEEAEILLETKDTNNIIETLRRQGVSTIAIKQGENGAVVANQKEIHKINALQINVVDTIGAGDAFNSGFLCGILENCSIDTCGLMGTIMGACAASSIGDIEGLINRSKLDIMLNKGKIVYR